MGRAKDPLREVATLALTAEDFAPNAALIKVIDYAFDQLCWSLNDADMYALVERLKAQLDSVQ